MTVTYCVDEITLDSDRISTKKDPMWGDVTVFHDVVIASEIVQPYLDGMAFKPREELEAYTPTVDGRWVMTGKHPDDGIISDRSQIHGRTVNPSYCKDLLDPKTRRPNRHGVRADVEIFNDKISSQMLENMVKGVKKDVSIGFFFTKDAKAGVVADGVFKGTEYDYRQTKMFHDHLAAGIDQGRCPSPYCGLGADEVKQRLTGVKLPDFDEVQKLNPELTRESFEVICSKLKSDNEDSLMEATILDALKNKIQNLLKDEYEAIKGEILSQKEQNAGDWWRRIDWSADEYRPIYDTLGDETRVLIMEAGLCPDCQDEEEEEPETVEESEEEEEEEEETESEKDEVPVPVKKVKPDPHEVLARFDALKENK